MQGGKSRFMITLTLLLFGTGIAAGYLYFSGSSTPLLKEDAAEYERSLQGDALFVKIYYPSDGRLIIEERRIERSMNMNIRAEAEAVAGEYFKGPSNKEKTVIPTGVKLLGIYLGSDGVLYINLSDELRRNFKGDATAEYLLLKGFYESIMTNVREVHDIKIIVEGKEIESIGGHLFSLYPLKETLQGGETVSD